MADEIITLDAVIEGWLTCLAAEDCRLRGGNAVNAKTKSFIMIEKHLEMGVFSLKKGLKFALQCVIILQDVWMC